MVIGLNQEFTISAAFALPMKLGQRADGIVWRRVREIEKEWLSILRLGGLAVHPLDCFVREAGEALVIDKVGRDLEAFTVKCFLGLCWCRVIGRHDTIV